MKKKFYKAQLGILNYGIRIDSGSVGANSSKFNTNNAHDSHPIGSYFKLCKESNDVCKTAGNFHNYDLQFNGSELAVGGAVLATFFIGLLFVIL